jgi:hypothetical protein
MKKLQSLVVGVIFAYFSITGIWQGLKIKHFERAELSWQEVSARIDASDIRHSYSRRTGDRWSAFWTYSYVIEGQRYEVSSVNIDGAYNANWYAQRNDAEEDGAKRQVGSRVVAYYDPDDPKRSVLDRRTPDDADTFAMVLWAIAGFVSIFAISVPIYSWVKNQ